VFDIIDEESKFPQATDLTLIEKLSRTFSKQSEFQRIKNQNLQFVIQHFAGPVRTIIDMLYVTLVEKFKYTLTYWYWSSGCRLLLLPWTALRN